jgi:hypothetical protein
LAVGASHQGILLLDTRRLFSQPLRIGLLSHLYGSPGSGPVAGGTAVQLRAYESTGGSTAGAKVLFGAVPATNFRVFVDSVGSTEVEANAPAGLPGTVNIGVYFPDGAMTMAASAFTYGPAIRDSTFNASTAEGSAAALYGYGLGKGAKISVGNGSSVGTATDRGLVYSPDLGLLNKLDYQIPSGSPGSADLTIQTSDGTSVYRNFMHYYPPILKYPLSGSELRIGLYDSSRKLLYFTQSDRVAVFSVASRSWLAPITLPAASNTREVRFAALSPQAGYLAITDAGTGSLIVIDLAKKSIVREVSLGQPGMLVYPPQIAYPVIFESETKVYTIALDELRLTDVTSGDALWRQPLTFVPQITSFTKIFLDATGRYLFFDRGTYYDLKENLYPTETRYWGCAETWPGAELAISPAGGISHAGCVLDSSLRITNQVYYSAAQFYSADSRHGRTWDPSGTYILQATSAGVDVIDAKTGGVKERIAIPVSNPDSTPSLVLDPDDRLLFIVTSEGLAALDVHDLPIGINSVDPASGPAGTLVTIRGNGFDADTQIIVDGKVVDAVFVDPYTLRISAPDHAVGPVQIRVKAPDGSQDSLDAAFVYRVFTGVASTGHAAEGEARCH